MTPPAASTVLALVADDMRRVDALIRERLHSDVPLVRQVAEYIVAGGGKRLRPALLLLLLAMVARDADRDTDCAADAPVG